MAHPNKLANTRILVFGGTSGIGFAVASLCLSSGATVMISGSQQPKVDSKVSLLQKAYPNLPSSQVSGHAVDLLDTDNLEANIKDLFEKVTDGGKQKLNHIVFTAGNIPNMPSIAEMTIPAALAMGTIRFLAPLLIAKLLSAGVYMPISPSSSLTLTGGTNTQKPFPGWTLAACWGGVAEGMMRGLAVDIAPIRVNMVEPGAIQTELLQKIVDRLGDVAVEAMKRETLTGTIGVPSDCAESYAWFMRDDFVTGTVAATNGGRYLAGPGVGLGRDGTGKA
ncbi:short chain dehydrogenase [Lindgomyces ingoldianus]|uniref:Short chain dehydrogenase n=1 Tax=Lindgomyces ingoldianus TaxID=673940 RepID=A0ACB6QD81_9PLEO|nr:short chain dehydrogenase [Lindgomyces ingoldianus]KAF2464077.1 short chain dehydrogenase [Lindgomyces ingoldianus]